MCEGTETDPEARAAELRRRRDAIDAEIERARAGDLPLLDDTALKDRFQQFMQILEAFVDAEWLAELDARLAMYRAELDGRESSGRGTGSRP